MGCDWTVVDASPLPTALDTAGTLSEMTVVVSWLGLHVILVSPRPTLPTAAFTGWSQVHSGTVTGSPAGTCGCRAGMLPGFLEPLLLSNFGRRGYKYGCHKLSRIWRSLGWALAGSKTKYHLNPGGRGLTRWLVACSNDTQGFLPTFL